MGNRPNFWVLWTPLWGIWHFQPSSGLLKMSFLWLLGKPLFTLSTFPNVHFASFDRFPFPLYEYSSLDESLLLCVNNPPFDFLFCFTPVWFSALTLEFEWAPLEALTTLTKPAVLWSPQLSTSSPCLSVGLKDALPTNFSCISQSYLKSNLSGWNSFAQQAQFISYIPLKKEKELLM